MSDFTKEELKEILTKDSKTLCSIIEANRILGCYKSSYKECMIELMRRRANGDDFKFEDFIKINTETYKLKFKIPNIKEIKQKLTSSIVNAFIQSNFIKNTEEEVEDKDEDF